MSSTTAPGMPFFVFAAVLLAAALHAAWNAIIKDGTDKVLSTIRVATFAALLAGCLIPFLPFPAPPSRPYIAASVLLHVCYFALVARAYRLSDMALTYPLMRGTAPFLIAVASAGLLGEPLQPAAWIGVAFISLGILTMVARRQGGDRAGIGTAVLNATVIAGYTVTDGAGSRLSGTPFGYALWIFFLTGIPLIAWATAHRRVEMVEAMKSGWQIGLAAGGATLTSYGIVLWAMTGAPVAIVAALRETSILFGTAIAGLVLREKLGATRMVGACLIALGALALRLA